MAGARARARAPALALALALALLAHGGAARDAAERRPPLRWLAPTGWSEELAPASLLQERVTPLVVQKQERAQAEQQRARRGRSESGGQEQQRRRGAQEYSGSTEYLGKTQTQTQQRKQLQVSEKLEDILRKDPSVQTVRGQVRLLLPHDPERELNIGILTDRGDLVRVRREADSVGADLMMRVAQLIEARGRVSTNAEGDPVMTVLHFRVLRQNE